MSAITTKVMASPCYDTMKHIEKNHKTLSMGNLEGTTQFRDKTYQCVIRFIKTTPNYAMPMYVIVELDPKKNLYVIKYL